MHAKRPTSWTRKAVLAVALVGFVFTSSFVASFKAVHAQMPVTDAAVAAGQGVSASTGVTRVSQQAKKDFWDLLFSNLVNTAALAILNAGQYFTQKIAYDAALAIASGREGQKAFFQTKDWGDYMKATALDAAGDALGTLNQIDGFQKLGINLCQPRNPLIALNIKLGFIDSLPGLLGGPVTQAAPQPRCTWNDIQDNWESFWNQADAFDALDQVGVMFTPGQNELNVGLQFNSFAQDFIVKKQAEAVNKRLQTDFLPKLSKIAGRVQTPAETIKDEMKRVNEQAVDQQGNLNATMTAAAFGKGALGILPAMLQTFTNTLTEKLMQRVFQRGLISISDLFLDEDATDLTRDFGAAGPTGGRAAAELANASLLTPKILSGSNYDELTQFATCPDTTTPGVSNCVMDSQFHIGVLRSSQGTPVTVRQAVAQGFLKGSFRLLPSSHQKNSDKRCYLEAYCYSNLVKLRRARILPVGWEMAANSPFNNPANPITLQEAMDRFNDCPLNADGTVDESKLPDPLHPWCHLVDPNWVLKYPKTLCRQLAPGPTLISPQSANRAQTCVDSVSCIAEDASGDCVGGYGYCLRERNVWKLDADACPAHFASCQAVKRTNGALTAFLMNTVDAGECNADNAGCLRYSTVKNALSNGGFEDVLAGTPAFPRDWTGTGAILNRSQSDSFRGSNSLGIVAGGSAEGQARSIVPGTELKLAAAVRLDEETAGPVRKGSVTVRFVDRAGNPIFRACATTKVGGLPKSCDSASDCEDGDACSDIQIATTCTSNADKTVTLDVPATHLGFSAGTCDVTAPPNAVGALVTLTSDAPSGNPIWFDEVGLTGQSFSGAPLDGLYLNGKVSSCPANQAGCTELVPLEAGTLNVLRNPSFEEKTADGTLPLFWTVDAASYEGDAFSGVDGSASVLLTSTPISQVVTGLLPDAIYSFSVSSRHDGTGTAPAGEARLTLRDSAGNVVQPAGTSESCPTSGGSARLTLPSGDSFQRVECQVTTPVDAYSLEVSLVRTSGGERMIADAAQLELAVAATPYHEGHGTAERVHLRKAPEGLTCNGTPDDPPECSSFAPACRKEEVGCDSYTPLSGGPAIPAVVTQNDSCPAACRGYATFRQEPTEFKDGKFPMFLIPSTAKSCQASEAGCEEFTNIERLGAGGEGRAYFSSLRLCMKPDDRTGTYYTWEGNDQRGYQLRTWTLQRSDVASAPTGAFGSDPTGGTGPCTSIVYDGAGNASCNDAALTDNPALCTRTQMLFNPDCREFYDVDGNIHYRLYSKVILATEDCVEYRQTTTTEGECRSHGGRWFQDECRYRVYALESRSCSAAANGCKAYSGNASRNVRVALNDGFEDGTTSGWTQAADAEPVCLSGVPSACNSNESVTAGGHSLKSTSSIVFKPVSGIARSGRQYLLTFWAKGGGDLSVRFSTIGSSAFTSDPATGDARPVPLTSEWAVYTVGPVLVGQDVPADEQLVFENPGAGDARPFFLDNIELREVFSSVYLIEGSWRTPSVCDQAPNGAASPQYMLGCEAYADRNKTTVHLRSFDRLCRAEAVGCTAFYDTKNTASPFPQVFNAVCTLSSACVPSVGVTCPCTAKVGGRDQVVCQATAGSTTCRYDAPDDAGGVLSGGGPGAGASPDGDSVRIPADEVVYLIDEARYRCDEANASCTAVGARTLHQDGDFTTAWNELTVKNDPDDYGDILCTKPEEFCQAFLRREDNAPLYFKDPNTHVCEFRQGVVVDGFNVSGWFKKGLEEPCYPEFLRGGNFYDLFRNSDAAYEGWAGECPTNFSMCKEFVDPQDTSEENPFGQPYYAILNDRLDRKSCQNRVSLLTGPAAATDASACVIFRQTEDLNLTIDSAATYAASQARNGALVEAVSGTANDANMVIKVKRDRACAQWLDCRTSETVFNPSTGTFQSVCTDYATCAEFQKVGDATRCVRYVPSARPAEVLTTKVYQSRSVAWAGREYSGFSLPEKYPVPDMVTVDVSNDPKRPDPRLVHSIGSCDEPYGAPCGEENNRGNRGTCLGPSAGKRQCVYPIDGTEAVTSPSQLLQARAKTQYPTISCRAYPQENAPFPADVADPNGWDESVADLNNGNPVFTGASPAFAGANVCQRRMVNGVEVSSCECSYQVAQYGSQRATKFFSLQSPDLPAGYCVGGAYDGYECDPNASGLRTTTNASCCSKLADVAGGLVAPDGTGIAPVVCESEGRCEPLTKVDRVVGYEGQCLERDLNTPINNRPDDFACVTWRPIGLVGGTRDIYNLNQTAGYFAAPDRRFYCAAEQTAWVLKLDIPSRTIAEGEEGFFEADWGRQTTLDANGDGEFTPYDLPTMNFFGPGIFNRTVRGYISEGGNCSHDADDQQGTAACIYPGVSRETCDAGPGNADGSGGGGDSCDSKKFGLEGPALGILGCYEISDDNPGGGRAEVVWPYIGPPIYEDQLHSIYFQITQDIYHRSCPVSSGTASGCEKAGNRGYRDGELVIPVFDGTGSRAHITTNPNQNVFLDCNDDGDDNIDNEDDDANDAKPLADDSLIRGDSGTLNGVYYLFKGNKWAADPSDGEGSIELSAHFDRNGLLSAVKLSTVDNGDEGTFGIRSMGFVFKPGCASVVRVDEPGEFGATGAFTDTVNQERTFDAGYIKDLNGNVSSLQAACRPFGAIGSVSSDPPNKPWTYVAARAEFPTVCETDDFNKAVSYRHEPVTASGMADYDATAVTTTQGFEQTLRRLFRRVYDAWNYVRLLPDGSGGTYQRNTSIPYDESADVDAGKLILSGHGSILGGLGWYPPRVATVDGSKCDVNGDCAAGETGNITINGQDDGVLIGQDGTFYVTARFFAWASHDAMPIISRSMIWGDAASGEPAAKGWYKNQKPFCSAGTDNAGAVNECRNFPGLTCRSSADCPNEAPCDRLPRRCANDETKSCDEDADCDGSTCVPLNRFGNTPGACSAAPLRFDHVYTCDVNDLAALAECEVADDMATNAPCRRRIADVWTCIYKPGAQVIDNWGWCNCTGSGCKNEDGANNDKQASGARETNPILDCNPHEVADDAVPWTPWKGEIRVTPRPEDAAAFVPPSGGGGGPVSGGTAVSDNFVTGRDRPFYTTSIEESLLFNDTPIPDVMADRTVEAVTQPSHGRLGNICDPNGCQQITKSGGINYIPDDGFVGIDSFEYRFVQNGNPSNVATVTIQVGS